MGGRTISAESSYLHLLLQTFGHISASAVINNPVLPCQALSHKSYFIKYKLRADLIVFPPLYCKRWQHLIELVWVQKLSRARSG